MRKQYERICRTIGLRTAAAVQKVDSAAAKVRMLYDERSS